jgi:SNF2 family DNA or RNA helicase
MIEKMNTFMCKLADVMKGWLGNRLPKLTDDWWNDLVYNNLLQSQREQISQNHISDLNSLDLIALLHVFDLNWINITNSWFVNTNVRQKVKDMMVVRNSWNNISSKEISREKIIDDVEIIIELMQSFDAKMSETKDMEQFIADVEDDKDFHEQFLSNNTLNRGDPIVNSPESNIIPGSMVALVSDPSKIGAVIAVDNNKYTLWINNNTQTFYREQIRLLVPKSGTNHLELSKVRALLTAYQINNPSSSNLYSLNSARIDFVPYQFRPALKMIKSEAQRLLVADDVGVGKTIEAGLILKEMEARSSINSVLIICPRPLIVERKWVLEMKRFDENFTQLDGKELLECIFEMERDGEWPERHKKTIIPYSLFREDLLEGIKSKTKEKRLLQKGLLQLDPIPHFDLVIVDEAHNIRNSSTWAYKGVELLTRSADAVLFLTATPLQNSNTDLFTLLNLLRPDVVLDKETFNSMAEPNVYINRLLRVVRNQEKGWQEIAKEELSHVLETTWGCNVIQHNPNFVRISNLLEKREITREKKIELLALIEGLHSFNNLITRTRRRDIENFCVRHTQTIKVSFTPSQQALYDALIDFETNFLKFMHGSRSVRFMMCTIMRQAASCIYGLVPFISDIINKKLSQIQENGELYEDDVELNSDLNNSISKLHEELSKLSVNLSKEDPKIEKLYKVIAKKQEEKNNRVILFSSFRHTLEYVKRHLESNGYRVAQVDGSVPDEERFQIRERFFMGRDRDEAIDVLLFSEVGCEGLDYQFCDTMINYDLPWNPMRIEQRIGRIDRRGQQSESVRIYNMITDGTIDAVIHDRCLSKIGVFEASIGDCSEILGDISEQIFKIMFDPRLTEEERKQKIEKMADNEIMKVQEMNRLEQEEKSLYGFDLSSYIQNMNVQNAESVWISPKSISNLVDTFLTDFLGEGEYIRINKGKEIGTMSISVENKQRLMADFRKLGLVNSNNASKLWNAYLKSTYSKQKITYDAKTAKDNNNIAFLTQMHPLVLQAAKHESEKLPCEIGISVSNDSISSGDYEFLIYAWKYVGFRPDIKLIVVSDNDTVRDSILEFMQYASDYFFSDDCHSVKWDFLEQIQYEKWQKAKSDYSSLVKEECDFRFEQLKQTTKKREIILKSQIENATDDRILRMRISQLEKLHNHYEEHKKLLEKVVQKADIHTQRLVRGVLHIE